VQIVISSPSMTSKLRLNAVLIGDPKDARRFQFHEPTEAQLQQIESWIREIQALMRNSA
jgi:hypothetical protein